MKYTVGDFKVCVEEARAFRRVAEWCNGEDVGNFLLGGMYAFAVNAAFSCELYLKAIFIHNSPVDEFPCGHKLDELFDLLPNNIQNALINDFSKRCSTDFHSFLHDSGDAFVEWRYALEKGVSINITALTTFAETLEKYICSLDKKVETV